MNREQILDLLDRWDPHGDQDLPDAVADALEEDAVVAAAFEARFERVVLEIVQDPPAPPRHAPVVARSRSWLTWAMPLTAVAATSLLTLTLGATMLSGGDSVPHAAAEQRAIDIPTRRLASSKEPEFRAAQGRTAADVDRRNVAGKSRGEELGKREIDMLKRLGYVGEPVAAPPAKPRPDANKRAPFLVTRRGAERDLPDDDADATTRHTPSPASGITLTEDDALSTFGLDVDTASWVLARSTLSQGFRPPTSSVRVEAFLNRLPYDYPAPPAGRPFQVDTEAVPSPWHKGRHLLRIGVQTRPATTRAPVHLTFLVDTSGSMNAPDKLPLVRQALSKLVAQLQDGDTVALVAYAGSAGVVLPPTDMTRRHEVLAALERLSAGGSTAMGAGIEAAYNLALQTYAEGAVNRVIIASDGDANVGQTKHGPLAESIRYYADKGITLTTVGVGSGGYNGSMMEGLAQKGDGFYAWLDGPAEAERVFVRDLTQSMQLAARDAKAQMVFNPEAVRSWRQVGYENRAIADADFRNDAVDAGEVGAGHQVTVLYEVELVPGSTASLGYVSLRAKPPGPDAAASEWKSPVPTSVVRPSMEAGSANTRIAVAAAGLAERLRDSPHVKSRSTAELAAAVHQAVRKDVREDVELAAMARILEGLASGETY